jgi:hypothetical protein
MPTPHICDRCHGPHRSAGTASAHRDAGSICASCASALTANLSRIPRLYAETEQALAPSTVRSVVRVSGSAPTATLPVRNQVVQARARVLSTLSSWSALVADERGVTAPRREVREMVVFLHRHLTWLMRHPAVRDLVAEVDEAVHQARRCLQSGQSRQVQVGTCRKPDCSGTLVAHMRSSGSGLPSEIRCVSDPTHRWAPHEWHAFIPSSARTA